MFLDSEAFGLMALGFHRVSFIELDCLRHGTLRGAIEEDSPAEIQRCPYCKARCPSTKLADGFTRKEVRWETFNRPASAAVTFLRDAKGRIKGTKRPRPRLDFQPTQHHPLAVRQRQGSD